MNNDRSEVHQLAVVIVHSLVMPETFSGIFKCVFKDWNIHSSIACYISIYNCGPDPHYKGRIQESVLRIQAHPRHAH